VSVLEPDNGPVGRLPERIFSGRWNRRCSITRRYQQGNQQWDKAALDGKQEGNSADGPLLPGRRRRADVRFTALSRQFDLLLPLCETRPLFFAQAVVTVRTADTLPGF